MWKDSELYDLISKIYDAGIDPKAWEVALPSVIAWTGFDSGSIAIWNTDMTKANVVVTSGMGEKFLQELNEYYIHINRFAEPMHRLVPVGGVYDFRELISWNDLKSDVYYNESMVPEGMHFDMGVVMDKGGGLGANMPLQRHRKRGAPDSEDRDRLKLLAPHITRAYQLNTRFWQLQSKISAFESMLENLRMGVVLLDVDGLVLHMNSLSEHILREFPHLQILDHKVQARSVEDSAKLRRSIFEAVETGIGNGLSAGSSLVIQDPQTGFRLFAQCVPLNASSSPLLAVPGQAAAVLFLSVPACTPVLSREILEDMFGLSRTEAELSRYLARGFKLQEYSAKRSISLETARAQLKSVFQKTGVHSQSELMRVLHTLPGLLDSVPPPPNRP